MSEDKVFGQLEDVELIQDSRMSIKASGAGQAHIPTLMVQEMQRSGIMLEERKAIVEKREGKLTRFFRQIYNYRIAGQTCPHCKKYQWGALYPEQEGFNFCQLCGGKMA